MIEIDNLKKSFHVSGREIPALRGVSFSVGDGEFVSVTGKSGSGKSTLLNLIAGLDRATSGKIIIDGVETSKMNDRQLSLFRANHIGMVFQSFNLIPELNATENILLGLSRRRFKGAEALSSAEKLTEMLELDELGDHLPGELSGGEQQRVAIGRALIGDPDIVLLDEPTGNLDGDTSNSFINLLSELHLKTKKTIILVTHDDEFASSADRKLTLRSGLLVSDGEIGQ